MMFQRKIKTKVRRKWRGGKKAQESGETRGRTWRTVREKEKGARIERNNRCGRREDLRVVPGAPKNILPAEIN